MRVKCANCERVYDIVEFDPYFQCYCGSSYYVVVDAKNNKKAKRWWRKKE